VGITEVDATGAATDTWEGTPSSLSMPNRSKELVRHSLVLDLLSPGLSHHGLEPGLVASLRGGLLDCILRVGIDPVSGHIRAGIGYLKGVTLVLTWTTMGLTLGVGKTATWDSPGTLSKSPPLSPRLFLSWVSLSLSDQLIL
jgi:hypothetical protein